MPTIIDGSGSATFQTPLPTSQGGTGNAAGYNVSAYSMVRLNTANGYGSTNTVIKRYSNVVTNQGSDITYADSATNGASFTINTNGIYSIALVTIATGTPVAGISLNSSQLTTAIISINAANRLVVSSSPAANPLNVSVTLYLQAGDVVRPHSDGQASSTASVDSFTITRVA